MHEFGSVQYRTTLNTLIRYPTIHQSSIVRVVSGTQHHCYRIVIIAIINIKSTSPLLEI
jgi:hypothetical protein